MCYCWCFSAHVAYIYRLAVWASAYVCDAHANINTLSPRFHHFLRWQPGPTPLFWPFLPSLLPFALRLISCSHRCCWEGQSVRPQHPPLLLSCLWCYTQSFAVACPWSRANHRHSTSLSNSILSIWLLKAGIANIPARETSSSLSLWLARASSNHQASFVLVWRVWFHRCDMPRFMWIITVGLFELNTMFLCNIILF